MAKKTTKKSVKTEIKSDAKKYQDIAKKEILKAKAKFVKEHKDVLAKLKLAKDRFVKEEKKARAYIKKNPEKAAAIAAGIGAVIGMTIGALKRKK